MSDSVEEESDTIIITNACIVVKHVFTSLEHDI